MGKRKIKLPIRNFKLRVHCFNHYENNHDCPDLEVRYFIECSEIETFKEAQATFFLQQLKNMIQFSNRQADSRGFSDVFICFFAGNRYLGSLKGVGKHSHVFYLFPSARNCIGLIKINYSYPFNRREGFTVSM